MITEANDDKFIVVRLPCLMEDEGNWHVLAICDDLLEVANFCKKYTDEDTGYFRMSSLVFIGSWFGDTKSSFLTEEQKKYLPENIREYRIRTAK